MLLISLNQVLHIWSTYCLTTPTGGVDRIISSLIMLSLRATTQAIYLWLLGSLMPYYSFFKSRGVYHLVVAGALSFVTFLLLKPLASQHLALKAYQF